MRGWVFCREGIAWGKRKMSGATPSFVGGNLFWYFGHGRRGVLHLASLNTTASTCLPLLIISPVTLVKMIAAAP